MNVSARRTTAIACFFLSGFAGLVYEIGWIRHASLIFGSTTLALSSVLAVFFGGLALGSAWFGRIALRTARPLRLYAQLELGLAVLAAASLLGFRLAEAAYGPVYRALAGQIEALFAARLALVAVVLLPPTVLMGGTLPLFCRQFAVRERTLAGAIGLLYGVNTLGAAAGAAAAGFWLVPHLGVQGSLFLAAALNVLVGAVMWRLAPAAVAAPELAAGAAPAAKAAPPARKKQAAGTAGPTARGERAAAGGDRPVATAAAVASARQPASPRAAVVGALFLVTGLVALGAEVVWTRFLALVVRNTVYTYTITLTVVLGGIVLGSVAASRWFDRARGRAIWFGALQAASALLVLALLFLPASFWRRLGPGPAPYLVLMLLPAALSGALFPLASRLALADASLAAATVGRLTALNTLGGIAGSLAIGFFVLPGLGIAAAARSVTGLGLASGLAAWLLLAEGGPRRRLALAAIGLAAVAAWAALPGLLGARLPADYLGSREQLVAYREGWSADLAVLRDKGARQLTIDRLWQGRDRKNHQIMAAHVPMLLHPRPESVLVIGIGTGQTASRFLLHGVRRLDAVDIEPAIFPFVAAHFDAGWMRDPRTRLIPDDGRTYVAHAAARYDVISVEVGQVFRPGVEAFYTREFYRLAEARLNPGGLLAQFVPIGFLGADDLRRVVATFRERFPECVLWHNAGELLLIGRRDAPLRLAGERLALLTRDGAVRSDLRWAHWGGESNWQNRPATFLAGFLSGPRGLAALAAGAPVYRDDRPVLAYATSRARPAQRLETANVDLLRRHLQPVTALLAEAPSAAAAMAAAVAEAAQAPGAGQAAEVPDIGALLPEVEWRREQNLRDIVAISWLGYVGELKNRLGAAAIEQALGEALRLNPENADANRMRGDALLLSGRAAEAERFYAAAVRLDPDDPLARRGLALVYLDTGRPAQAVPLLQSVLAQDPADAPAENYLGAALAQQGRLPEAIARFEAALRLQPDYRDAQANLARARGELRARAR